MSAIDSAMSHLDPEEAALVARARSLLESREDPTAEEAEGLSGGEDKEERARCAPPPTRRPVAAKPTPKSAPVGAEAASRRAVAAAAAARDAVNAFGTAAAACDLQERAQQRVREARVAEAQRRKAEEAAQGEARARAAAEAEKVAKFQKDVAAR